MLFVDISGFTSFTEALRHAYGSRRGTEELTKHLDAVYTAFIAEVERYMESVTGFAGEPLLVGLIIWTSLRRRELWLALSPQVTFANSGRFSMSLTSPFGKYPAASINRRWSGKPNKNASRLASFGNCSACACNLPNQIGLIDNVYFTHFTCHDDGFLYSHAPFIYLRAIQSFYR